MENKPENRPELKPETRVESKTDAPGGKPTEIARVQGEIPALDAKFRPLKIGDRVSFVMAGFFLPREQENFGTISAIDKFGGVTIEVVGVYKHFLSNKKIADTSNTVYFTHHVYSKEHHARVYSIQQNDHDLFISHFDE